MPLYPISTTIPDFWNYVACTKVSASRHKKICTRTLKRYPKNWRKHVSCKLYMWLELRQRYLLFHLLMKEYDQEEFSIVRKHTNLITWAYFVFTAFTSSQGSAHYQKLVFLTEKTFFHVIAGENNHHHLLCVQILWTSEAQGVARTIQICFARQNWTGFGICLRLHSWKCHVPGLWRQTQTPTSCGEGPAPPNIKKK